MLSRTGGGGAAAGASLPFLSAAAILVLLWPGQLAAAGLQGGLLAIAGLALLLYSHLLLERAPLVDAARFGGGDPWVPPAGLLPLGARWGLREEVLLAFLVAPALAVRAQGATFEGRLLCLAGAWLPLLLPALFAPLAAAWLRRRHVRLGEAGGGWELAPRLGRALVGAVALLLAVTGAWLLGAGFRSFLPAA